MKNNIAIALLVCIAIMYISCQREISAEPRPHRTSGTLHDFFTLNRSSAEVFSVAVSSAVPVKTAKGTKLFFPANAFVDENNELVTGNVKIQIKEIVTPGEMIWNDMPTTSGNRLLESGGEFNITVSQNNRKLKLAAGKFIKIQLPDAGVPAPGMQVFNGVTNADGSVNWIPNNNGGNFVVRDSLFLKTELFCDSINWINCDKFINEPTVEFSVYPGNAPSADSTNVFIHLTGRNTIVKMNWTQGLSYFNSSMLLAVPSSIIGISKKDGQLYVSVTTAHIQNGQSATLNFSPCTAEQLKARLALLR